MQAQPKQLLQKCPYCQWEFNRLDRPNEYCSDLCHRRALRNGIRPRHYNPKAKHTIKCIVCGHTAYVASEKQITCGKDTCRAEYKKIQNRDRARKIAQGGYQKTTLVQEIAQVRELFGLRPLKPGKTKCLKCEATFLSEDIPTQRICPLCRAGGENEVLWKCKRTK